MTHEQKFIILQNVSIFLSCEHHVAKNIKRFQSNFSCFDFSIGAINANKQLPVTTHNTTEHETRFSKFSSLWRMVFICSLHSCKKNVGRKELFFMYPFPCVKFDYKKSRSEQTNVLQSNFGSLSFLVDGRMVGKK